MRVVNTFGFETAEVPNENFGQSQKYYLDPPASIKTKIDKTFKETHEAIQARY